MNDSRMKTLLKWRPTNAGDNVLTFALGNRCIQTFQWTRLVHTQAAVGNHHFVHCDVTGRSRQVSTSMFLCVSYWFSSKLHGQAPPKAVPCGTENQRHDFNVRRSIFNGRVLVSHLVAIVDCWQNDYWNDGLIERCPCRPSASVRAVPNDVVRSVPYAHDFEQGAVPVGVFLGSRRPRSDARCGCEIVGRASFPVVADACWLCSGTIRSRNLVTAGHFLCPSRDLRIQENIWPKSDDLLSSVRFKINNWKFTPSR